jgi:hypothetical protein
MGTVLVTVAGPGAQIDLALPDDAPVGDLVPDLVRRCAAEPRPWSRWALGPPNGEPFPPRSALATLGVVDGAELELRDMVAGDAAGRVPEPGPGAGGAGSEADAEVRRHRIVHLVERLVDDIARIRTGRNPLLEYAAPEARRRLRALAPGRLDRVAEGALSDLSLTVRWPRDPRAPVEAIAAFTETAGAAAGTLPRPATPWSGPGPAPRPARRVGLRITADPHCRYVFDVSVETAAPSG